MAALASSGLENHPYPKQQFLRIEPDSKESCCPIRRIRSWILDDIVRAGPVQCLAALTESDCDGRYASSTSTQEPIYDGLSFMTQIVAEGMKPGVPCPCRRLILLVQAAVTWRDYNFMTLTARKAIAIAREQGTDWDYLAILCPELGTKVEQSIRDSE
ncbi:hypothetical protein DOTSEDRAFT_29780 [Dothistroma septosporum NZE10]|uniref:Uncharacterized protein n=1 Tax=Dothistroma septosporum (strain NZE10 / CBS 128990) TaxID=675120 RepID=M2YHP6_DOTSN|nr:hypothetical protein DOTSEDRAFT_29780 [Dothistroma septosporum NZE10]